MATTYKTTQISVDGEVGSAEEYGLHIEAIDVRDIAAERGKGYTHTAKVAMTIDGVQVCGTVYLKPDNGSVDLFSRPASAPIKPTAGMTPKAKAASPIAGRFARRG